MCDLYVQTLGGEICKVYFGLYIAYFLCTIYSNKIMCVCVCTVGSNSMLVMPSLLPSNVPLFWRVPVMTKRSSMLHQAWEYSLNPVVCLLTA